MSLDSGTSRDRLKGMAQVMLCYFQRRSTPCLSEFRWCVIDSLMRYIWQQYGQHARQSHRQDTTCCQMTMYCIGINNVTCTHVHMYNFFLLYVHIKNMQDKQWFYSLIFLSSLRTHETTVSTYQGSSCKFICFKRYLSMSWSGRGDTWKKMMSCGKGLGALQS